MMEYKAILDDGSRHDVVRHFGILGMHWGERRYQNPDGSLTPEGRKRYGIKEGSREEAAFVGASKGGILGGIAAVVKYNNSNKKRATSEKDAPKQKSLKATLSEISELDVAELSDGSLWISDVPKSNSGDANRLAPTIRTVQYINATDKNTGQKASISLGNKRGTAKALRAMGYTMEEIADKLDMSSGSVSRLLS